MLRKIVIFILFSVVFPVQIASADFVLVDQDEKRLILGVVHEITQQDVEYFEAISGVLDELATDGTPLSLVVLLDSGGGNLNAAMAIGRILRRHHAMVLVEKPSKCLSACVLVLAGGISRSTSGTVGIHRPYVGTAEETTMHIQQQRYSSLRQDVLSYLSDMNVSPTLYEHMLVVPPESMRILDSRELELYGLTGRDPMYDELMENKLAVELDISRAELASRRNLIDKACPNSMSHDIGEAAECYERILQHGR